MNTMARIETEIPEIDIEATREAINFFGLLKNILVAFDPNLALWGGIGQYFASDEKTHKIRFSGRLVSEYTPSSVLWHELAHVWQCECEFGGDRRLFAAAYDDELEKDGYDFNQAPVSGRNFKIYQKNHWEVEARTFEEYAKELPLFTSVPSGWWGDDQISPGWEFNWMTTTPTPIYDDYAVTDNSWPNNNRKYSVKVFETFIKPPIKITTFSSLMDE